MTFADDSTDPSSSPSPPPCDRKNSYKRSKSFHEDADLKDAEPFIVPPEEEEDGDQYLLTTCKCDYCLEEIRRELEEREAEREQHKEEEVDLGPNEEHDRFESDVHAHHHHHHPHGQELLPIGVFPFNEQLMDRFTQMYDEDKDGDRPRPDFQERRSHHYKHRPHSSGGAVRIMDMPPPPPPRQSGSAASTSLKVLSTTKNILPLPSGREIFAITGRLAGKPSLDGEQSLLSKKSSRRSSSGSSSSSSSSSGGCCGSGKTTRREQFANFITHFPWIFACLYGTWTLARLSQDRNHLACALIYGAAFTCVFGASTIYHFCAYAGMCRRIVGIMQKLDRSLIYVVVAASFTPWLMLRSFEPAWMAPACHVAAWLICLAGIAYEFLSPKSGRRDKSLTNLLYFIQIFLPLTCIFFVNDLSGLGGIIFGALFYAVGFYFYNRDGRIPYAHAIWHLNCNLGSLVHFYIVAIYLFGPQQLTREVPEALGVFSWSPLALFF